MTARADVIATALGTVGETESPPNSNRTRFGAAYGLNGVPWCAIWVWWVYQQTGHNLRAELTPGWAYTPTGLQAGRRAGWAIKHRDAQPGDIVFYNFPRGDAVDHVGIVYRNEGGDTFQAIEGNTSAGNNADGGQVQVRRRPWSLVAGMLRPPYLTDGGAVPPVPPTTTTGDAPMFLAYNTISGHPNSGDGWLFEAGKRRKVDGSHFPFLRDVVGRVSGSGAVFPVDNAPLWDVLMANWAPQA